MRSLVEQDVNGGKLLRLFDFRVEASKLIALFYPEAAEHRPAVVAFTEWIHAEVERGCKRGLPRP